MFACTKSKKLLFRFSSFTFQQKPERLSRSFPLALFRASAQMSEKDAKAGATDRPAHVTAGSRKSRTASTNEVSLKPPGGSFD